ncbi:MAG: MATE family efflux transporter, partial [Bacteroidaceae bacterium]|nr:MATE family efflux transporter [Bacteroidaceae bacterium]
DLVRNIVTIGLSPCLMNAAACLVVLLINRGLLTYGGDIAVGAYSIINSMGFLYVMTVMGFTQAMQPIAGYNYGAKRYERVLSVFYRTLLCATIVTTLGFLISELFPDACIRIFTNDSELTGIARHGMRINFLVFPLIGSQIVISNLFQNIGMPGKSIIMSLSRQVLLLIPCLIILPRHFDIDGIWYSMPLSDAVSVLLGVALIIPQIHRLKQMVKQENI